MTEMPKNSSPQPMASGGGIGEEGLGSIFKGQAIKNLALLQ